MKSLPKLPNWVAKYTGCFKKRRQCVLGEGVLEGVVHNVTVMVNCNIKIVMYELCLTLKLKGLSNFESGAMRTIPSKVTEMVLDLPTPPPPSKVPEAAA